jgi:hypothetical protein
MKQKHAQYFHTGTTGLTIEMCGSDSVLHLDGRFGIERCHQKATDHAKMMNRNLGKGITGYQIFRGSKSLSKFVPVEEA